MNHFCAIQKLVRFLSDIIHLPCLLISYNCSLEASCEQGLYRRFQIALVKRHVGSCIVPPVNQLVNVGEPLLLALYLVVKVLKLLCLAIALCSTLIACLEVTSSNAPYPTIKREASSDMQ